ncbi:MAG TPA: cytochrome c biogenesis protein CcsA [Myxococcota bacterium]|jgi:heme exporter protein C|nr:cytochrome c biogenesis protein CcsA [Myxococcota bacterium]
MTGRRVFIGLMVVLGAMYVEAIREVFFVAPVERVMGIVQKIFYFHVSAAMTFFLAFVVCAVGSVAYLVTRKARWDALAAASAEVGVLMCAMVLLTGPLWAWPVWGTPWVWDDPQLMLTLGVFLVYTSYLLARSLLGGDAAGRRLAAVLGILGALAIPFIHYAVQLWGGHHPRVMRGEGGGLDPTMRRVFALCVVSFLGLYGLLLWTRMRLFLDEARLRVLQNRVETEVA